MVDWNLRVPWGYGSEYRTLAWVRDELAKTHHPEYVRRLCCWLNSKGGRVGVGSTWRATQPAKPGVAPEGKSFHQTQTFRDGSRWACAIDAVYIDGPDAGDAHDTIQWREVPTQGSDEARRYGVHANVGTPNDPYPRGESWHIQPIEIDGYDTWIAQGRPFPAPNYPLPDEETPMIHRQRVVDLRSGIGANQPVKVNLPPNVTAALCHAVIVSPAGPGFLTADGGATSSVNWGHTDTADGLFSVRAGESVTLSCPAGQLVIDTDQVWY